MRGAGRGRQRVRTAFGHHPDFDRIAARMTDTEPPPEASKPIPGVVILGSPIAQRPEDLKASDHQPQIAERPTRQEMSATAVVALDGKSLATRLGSPPGND
jgi:hypothetical protein